MPGDRAASCQPTGRPTDASANRPDHLAEHAVAAGPPPASRGASGLRNGRQVKVAYITMRFPAPSETFAGTDVRILRDLGVSVSVHTMRAPASNSARMLEERRLSGLAISQGTLQPI